MKIVVGSSYPALLLVLSGCGGYESKVDQSRKGAGSHSQANWISARMGWRTVVIDPALEIGAMFYSSDDADSSGITLLASIFPRGTKKEALDAIAFITSEDFLDWQSLILGKTFRVVYSSDFARVTHKKTVW